MINERNKLRKKSNIQEKGQCIEVVDIVVIYCYIWWLLWGQLLGIFYAFECGLYSL